MARVPEATLERLKAKVSLERLAERAGVALKPHGKDRIGLCPFHDDREPSLVITPAKNLWHCLGACQAGGTAIDWVMKAEGVSFRHAVELLQNDYAPESCALAAGRAPVRQASVPKLPTPLARGAEDAALLGQVVDYYHETLKKTPEAMRYLERRGIAHPEALDRFKLGVANRTLGYRLPVKNRKAGAAMRGQLQRIGILRPSGHEHFNGSLVIPVLDAAGQVLEVYGRKMTSNLRKGTPLHLYLPGPHQGVWNADSLATSPEVILCESLIDALTFWCAGLRNVTASYGVEGFTAEHLATLKASGIERVLIAYDRDAAGDAAAEKLSERLMPEGFDCFRVQFPKGLDANAYALSVQPAGPALGLAVRSAAWMGNGAPSSRPTTTPIHAAAGPVSALVPAEPADAPAACTPSTPLAAGVAAPEPLPAAVIPPPPAPGVAAEVSEVAPGILPAATWAHPCSARDVVVAFGDRRYRVRGLAKNSSHEGLKVNLLVSRPADGALSPGAPSYRPSLDIFDGPGEAVHVDTLDLYQARARGAFIRQAAAELGVKEDVIKHDLGTLLLELEALQEEALREADVPKPVALDDAERAEALGFLESPDLIGRIQADVDRTGLVGEATNTLVAYLACVSRKLNQPLALLVQSTSAAGKSSLMDAVLAFVPEEDRVQYSAMTGQSLFYMGETDLKHKVLAIVEEEGVAQAAYALKLLQSEGELTIASTAKDPVTGKLATQEYHVEGPVSIFLTTTAVDLDEELINRCLVLSVDEGREQTRAIHRRQREKRTLEGLLAKTGREAILVRHRNAQRLLEPLAVVNPYAEHLTFVHGQTRTRRDHEKYLTLIDAIALLHQHQRAVKTLTHGERSVRYVEVTLDDIALANRLAHEVLGRTLDELPPQTRRLLRAVRAMVRETCEREAVQQCDVRFSRRDVREHTGWGNTQLRVHLERLVEMEYLLVHRGGRGQSFVYELLYDGEPGDERPFLSGLIDIEALRDAATTDTSRGADPEVAGSSRSHDGVQSPRCRSEGSGENPHPDSPLAANGADPGETAEIRRGNGAASQAHPVTAG